jgi:crotonobetainyl-CoA:carnitine CoA-transferase CaiB-like acyl-CoA transferase
MQRPLEGVRILAVEQYGAGPFGTQHLADLGAEVIKIENRRLGGDYARGLGPYFVDGAEGDDASLFYQSINRNKKSLSLDLTHPDGVKVFHRLVRDADGVANNLRGDVPEKLGLTYNDLSVHNLAIVCAHCSAYGREGPRRNWPGYDYLMQAETGCFHMSGEPDTPPTRMGLSVVDFLGGTYMALGMLAGIIGARTTGQGRDVDVNLYDTALSNLSYMSAWALNSDYQPARVARSGHPSMTPCQLYKTSDGWIFIMGNKEKFWPALCNEIGRPDMIDDARFASFQDRRRNRDLVTEYLDDALQAGTTAQWLKRLAGKVPVAPVRTPREALDDPDLVRRGKIQELFLSDGRSSFRMLTSPIRTLGDGADHPCPPLGDDTVAILREAGYSDTDIKDLKDSGAI